MSLRITSQTVKAERPEEFDYVQTRDYRYRALQGARFGVSLGEGGARSLASPHRSIAHQPAIAVGELRHSLVPLQPPSRSSASAGRGSATRPQHSIAGHQRLGNAAPEHQLSKPKQKAHRSNDVVIMGGKNAYHPWPWRRSTSSSQRCSAWRTAAGESPYPNRPIDIVVRPPAASSTWSPRRRRTGRPRLERAIARTQGPAPAATSVPRRSRGASPTATRLVTGPAVLVNPTRYRDAGWDRWEISNASASRSGTRARRWTIRQCRSRRSRKSSTTRAADPVSSTSEMPAPGRRPISPRRSCSVWRHRA